MNVGVALIDSQLERATLFCAVCCSHARMLPLCRLVLRNLVGGATETTSLACVYVRRRRTWVSAIQRRLFVLPFRQTVTDPAQTAFEIAPLQRPCTDQADGASIGLPSLLGIC